MRVLSCTIRARRTRCGLDLGVRLWFGSCLAILRCSRRCFVTTRDVGEVGELRGGYFVRGGLWRFGRWGICGGIDLFILLYGDMSR